MYQAEIKNDGTAVLKVNSQGFEFDMDLDGDGIHPPDTCLIALGTCAGVYVRKYFGNAKEKPQGFKIKVWGDLDGDKGSYKFKKIYMEIEIKGLQLDEMHKAALLRFIDNCPVYNTVKANAVMDVKII